MKKYLIISLILISVVSCKKEHFSFLSVEKRLTRTSWRIDSFVDTADNTQLEYSKNIYSFFTDGTLKVTDTSDSSFYYSTWELIDENEYLRIGSNTYKLKIITKKLLGLQYGTIEIYYKPV